MESLYFTEEHELFRESVREFFKQEAAPYFDKWEKSGKIDREIFQFKFFPACRAIQ